MNNKLKHFVDLDIIDSESIRQILNIGHRLKESKESKNYLQSKILSMIFEKPSTRTRISFEVGMKQLGGDVVTLDHADTQLGRGESIEDTIRVISQYVDIIMYRGSAESRLNEILKVSKVPVINGLTDESHPCQIMADIMTIEEHFKTLDGIEICWLGDGNNVCNSWIDSCKHFNFNLRICTPTEHKPKFSRIEKINKYKQNIKFFESPKDAVKNANVLVTDTWSSMGTENSPKRMEKFRDFQVNSKLIKHANKNFIFLHCMPAHRGQEVSSEIIDGEKSLVFTEAYNRLFIQKSILLWCMQVNL